MKRILLILVVLSFGTSFAQSIDDYINLLRSDLKTQKSALITEAMRFSDAEASKFWPIYNEYSLKLDQIGNKRVKFIKDFAANLNNMSNETADKIIDQAFDFREERLDLQEDLYDKVKDAIGAAKAAKLLQIEHQINLLIDLKINSELPLLEKTANESKHENK